MDVIPAGPMRRRWSAEAKARIIASSFEPGANIAEIARTHGLLPQQLYAWRHDSIPGKRLASKKLGFVPAVIEDAGGTGSADGGGDEIVIRTAALAIHVPPGASEDHIARVTGWITPRWRTVGNMSVTSGTLLEKRISSTPIPTINGIDIVSRHRAEGRTRIWSMTKG